MVLVMVCFYRRKRRERRDSAIGSGENQARDAVGQLGLVEIDKKSNRNVEEFHVTEKLRLFESAEQAPLVDRFHKPRPLVLMHLNRSGNDVLGQAVGFGEQRVHGFSLFPPLPPVTPNLQKQQ